MSRWRPAPPKTSPYITTEGAQRLQQELKQLWKVERPAITATVKAAAANGDRSENGDYIYGKMRMREIDRRIRYLSKRLDVLNVVDRLPKDQSKVFFGAWVTLEGENAEEFTVRIVGYDEIDAKQNWISVDSPLARAILGKQVDDEVTYNTPSGPAEAYIIEIRYQI
ncbi:MAG: transcription elongation factor GreB [Porticoccaceae bacterium]